MPSMDDRQGEAMKPSPSPAAMTDEVHKIAEIIDPDAFAHIESADDYPAWRARREACKFAALQKAEAIDALLASRGTRALTEEEAATVRTARRWKAENNLNNHEQNLLAIISRLTGEPSA